LSGEPCSDDSLQLQASSSQCSRSTASGLETQPSLHQTRRLFRGNGKKRFTHGANSHTTFDESSSIKKSEDKRKEREGKKFGKQVQIEKIKERERSKKEMGEKLKALKRSTSFAQLVGLIELLTFAIAERKDILDNSREKDDEFDVAVEDAISDRPAKRGKASNGKSIPRSVRDKKYGFGGVGRRAKQNTKESTDDFDPSKAGRGGKPGRGGFKGRHSTKRLGKSRRISAKSKS
jgi:rRNA-processing protein EBP2